MLSLSRHLSIVEGLHLIELVVGSVKVMGKMCKRLVGGRLEEKTVLCLVITPRPRSVRKG